MVNVLEYALGMDPTQPGATPVALQVLDGHATLTLTRPTTHSGVLLEVEVSDSLLGPWSSEPAGILLAAATVHPDGTETLVFRSVQSVVEQPVLFLRLRASLVP
jgi:hypothetical protein